MQTTNCEYGQTLVDIAIQMTGDASRIFEVAALNNVNITDDLISGQIVNAPDSALNKTAIVAFLNITPYKPASDDGKYGIGADGQVDSGIGFWAVEDDNIVQ